MLKKLLILSTIIILIFAFVSCQDKTDEEQSTTTTTPKSTTDNNGGVDIPPQKTYSSTTKEKWIDAFTFLNDENVNVSYSFLATKDDENYSENEYGVIKQYNGIQHKTTTIEEIEDGVSTIDSSSSYYLDIENCTFGMGLASVFRDVNSYVISGEDFGFSAFSYNETEKCYTKSMDTETRTTTVKVYFTSNTLDKIEIQITRLKSGDVSNISYCFYPVEEVIFPKDDAIKFANDAIASLSSVKNVSFSNSSDEALNATVEETITALKSLFEALTLDNPSYFSMGDGVYFQFDNTPVELLESQFYCNIIVISTNENGISRIMLPDNGYMQIYFEY